MRKKFVAGNWKMNTTLKSAEELARALVQAVGAEERVRVAVCPPFPYLSKVADILRGSKIALGAQNCAFEKAGAYSGEVSPGMLLDVGCTLVMLGHSERRHHQFESDIVINTKLKLALATGLQVILCIGESLDDRQSNRTEKVLETQLIGCLAGISAEQLAKVTIAYEPIWAVGTGHNATPEQAQSAHAFTRQQVAKLCGQPAADALIIQYGGSVTAENAATLLGQPDVDGALVGGASLSVEKFLPIVKAGIRG